MGKILQGVSIKMTLLEISKKNNSNKIVHEFEKFYDQKFGPIRNKVTNILEIGIWRGGSLKMWRDYFPNATIYGMDINLAGSEKNLLNEERIVPLLCDATNLDELTTTLKEKTPGTFDIIIDDASHRMDHQQITMMYLFSKVCSGGFYCIEDVHTSLTTTPKHMEEWMVEKDGSNTTYKMLVEYQRSGKIRSKYMTHDAEKILEEGIKSCELYIGKRGKIGSITSAIRKK